MGDKNHENHTSSKDVAKAQKWMKNLGSSITVNGKFTIGMTNAICTFQRKNKLPITGILDDATWKKLKSANAWYRKLFKWVSTP